MLLIINQDWVGAQVHVYPYWRGDYGYCSAGIFQWPLMVTGCPLRLAPHQIQPRHTAMRFQGEDIDAFLSNPAHTEL